VVDAADELVALTEAAEAEAELLAEALADAL
jgi:hypothetical protein